MLYKIDGFCVAECDSCSSEFADTYTSMNDIRREMKNSGWRVVYEHEYKDWMVTCPECLREPL